MWSNSECSIKLKKALICGITLNLNFASCSNNQNSPIDLPIFVILNKSELRKEEDYYMMKCYSAVLLSFCLTLILNTSQIFAGIPQPQVSQLEKEIMQLGRAKRYDLIPAILKKANPNELKKLIILQLELALYIANRMHFDIAEEESDAFRYKEQTLIPSPMDRIRAQWIFLLMQAEHELIALKQINPESLSYALELIRTFLGDIGFMKNEYRIRTFDDVKKAMAEYFRLLFEHMDIVKNAKQYPEYNIMRKSMLNMSIEAGPIILKPLAKPPLAKPKPIKLVPITKPAPAKPKVKLVPVTKPAPAKPKMVNT